MRTHPLPYGRAVGGTRYWAILGICFTLMPIHPGVGADYELGPAPPLPKAEQVARGLRRELRPFGPTLPDLDMTSREQVRNFFHAVYGGSVMGPMGWTGSHDTCTPGTTDPAFRERVVLRVNYFRAMAGVPSDVVFSDANHPQAQAAALMMSANNALSHAPPASWSCYSADGAEAAGNANIAIGTAGTDSMDGYMEDKGANNASVGHRRWMLYPQTRIMSTGDIPFVSGSRREANALRVIDGHFLDPRPATRTGFVAWPPAGHVPYRLVYNRWSLSYAGADFSSAAVGVSSNGVSLPVAVEARGAGAGENSLVWIPAGLNGASPSDWPRPADDATYTVSVQGVRVGGVTTNFTYEVTVMDPDREGPDTVHPTPAGPAAPVVGQANAYTFAAVPLAAAYQWRRSVLAPLTRVEGGEEGLADFEVNAPGGYAVLTGIPGATGSFAFHLAHAETVDQLLVYARVLRPRAGAELQFRSRLGWASSNQVAVVSVSTDDGSSWESIYRQAGTGEAGETGFQSRRVSLAPYVGRAIRCRFGYELGNGIYFYQTDPGVGWYLDDISWTATDEVTAAVVSEVAAGESFAFVPPQAGTFGLDVRGLVAGAYPLSWGPMVEVAATVDDTPSVAFVGPPAVANGQLQVAFEVGNARPGLTFALERRVLPAGWTVETGAVFEDIGGSRYRATVALAGLPNALFRLVVR